MNEYSLSAASVCTGRCNFNPPFYASPTFFFVSEIGGAVYKKKFTDLLFYLKIMIVFFIGPSFNISLWDAHPNNNISL